jgi:hypothetical protein
MALSSYSLSIALLTSRFLAEAIVSPKIQSLNS